MKKFIRQYHLDTVCSEDFVDAQGWTTGDEFDNSADLYMEVQEMWQCEEFSMELQDWCDNAHVGDVFEDDDIRVTVVEG